MCTVKSNVYSFPIASLIDQSIQAINTQSLSEYLFNITSMRFIVTIIAALFLLFPAVIS